jgi:hypothetical protein
MGSTSDDYVKMTRPAATTPARPDAKKKPGAADTRRDHREDVGQDPAKAKSETEEAGYGYRV